MRRRATVVVGVVVALLLGSYVLFSQRVVSRLRADEVSEPNVREAFMAIAPACEDGLYLVPKVIE